MSFKSLIAKIFNFKEEEIVLTQEQSEKYSGIMIESFALTTVISVISALLSKCEFITEEKGKPVRGNLWYILNIKPNPNQCKSEFWQEFFCKLLLNSEALILPVNDKLIIADGFNKDSRVLYGSAFTDIYRDDFSFNSTYYADDVFYLRYANANVSAIASNILLQYSELMNEATEKYYKSGGQKGIVEVSPIAKGDKDFEEKFRRLMNEQFKPFFKARNAVLPLLQGYKYTPLESKSTKATNEVSDYKTLFDEAMKRCAQAFRISPALVSGDVAGISDALDYTFTAGIDPIANMTAEMLTARNYSLRDVTERGCRIRMDTTAVKHTDLFSIAANIDKLISSGFSNIDELRSRVGLYEIGEEWSKKHYITKNYERIQNAEGGEKNAE